MKSDRQLNAGAVLIVAPLGKDAQLASAALAEHQIAARTCTTLSDATARISGGTNALIVAEEALTASELPDLISVLARQPTWSDLPVIVLTAIGSPHSSARIVDAFGAQANITLLERPLHATTLVSATRAALRARRRQYEVRNLFEQREAALARITDAFAALDSNWRYIFVNEAAARLAGFERDEMIGRSIWDIYPEAVGGNFYRHMMRAADTQQPQSFEQYYERWHCWLETRIYPAGEAGVAVFRANINERKRQEQLMREAERKMHESEAVLRLALEAAGAGTFDYHPQSRDMRLGPRAKQLLGLQTEAQLTLAEIISILHPQDRGKVLRALGDALRAGGEPIDVEFRVNRANDAAERWILATGRALSQVSGRAERCIGTLVDVTERKRAEQELRAALDTLSATLVGMSDGFVLYDREFRIVNVNPSAAAVGHKSVEEMQGRVLWEAYPDLAGSDLEAHYRQAMEQRVPVQFEFFYALFDRWYENRCQPVPQGLAVFIADVTERRRAQEALTESERRFRTLADAIPQLAWTAQADGSIVWYNRRWYEYTGTSAEQMNGWGWQSVHDPQALPTVLERWKYSIATGEPFEMVFPLRGADGVFRPFLTRVEPLKDSEGRVVQWFGTNTNIDELKRTQDALQEAKRAAEQASRAKDQFLAMISHELRTPLTPVLMAVDALQREPSINDTIRADLDVIHRNIELEALLIDDLLDLTRVAHGKLELRQDAVDIHALLAHALSISASEVGAKQICVIQDLRASEHHSWADAARLQQVFWNLIKNAVKFTPAGGELRLTTRNVGDHRIAVEVCDTGIGIEPALLPRIFDAFEQGGRNMTSQYGGMGLGLAISKSIIDLHDGSIVAQSEGRGRGATFIVTLPAIATSLLDEPVYPADVTMPLNSDARILLVEDHVDTARVLHRMIERAGYKVTLAQTIAAARDAAAEQKFDLVISDLGLPDGAGTDLMRDLHDRYGLRGIALSGFGTTDDIASSRAAGFAEHLTKPVDWDRLRLAIERATAASKTGELRPA